MIGFLSFYTSKGLIKQKTEQYANDILMETGENVNVKLREIERLSFQIVSSMPIQQALKKANLRSWTIIICGSCCLLVLLISLGLSSNISMPLRKLSAMIEKVGKGDFNVSSSYEARDEVGILSSHFNKMVVQVQNLIQEVYQEQYLKQNAELKSLRMQIKPHFLYNTLTISIFNFVNSWNELMFAMLFMPDVNKMTLPVSLTRFKGQYSTS